ncbi:MAG: hypothetical protein RIR70_473, partial [Pseudomonadota bacterium]
MRAWGLCAAVGLAIVLIHGETALQMASIWVRSDTFAHGFLIVPISLWLLWRERRLLAAVPVSAQGVFLLPLIGACLVWVAASLVDLKSPAQFALVAMLLSAVGVILGSRFFKAAMFPLLFLFFAVPFGEFLLPLMMEATARFTSAALSASGVPVYREGLQFFIPSGQWSVVEACSGLRYLIASAVAGSLFAYLNFRGTWRRVLFVGLSLAVPIVANWVRAYLIVMLGHFTNNRLAAGADHLVYGWVFFALVMLGLFAIGMRFAEPDDAVSVQASPRVASPLPWGHAFAVLLAVAAGPMGVFLL